MISKKVISNMTTKTTQKALGYALSIRQKANELETLILKLEAGVASAETAFDIWDQVFDLANEAAAKTDRLRSLSASESLDIQSITE